MPSSHRVPHLDALFHPLRIGNLTLKNRIVMAPIRHRRRPTSGFPLDLPDPVVVARPGKTDTPVHKKQDCLDKERDDG